MYCMFKTLFTVFNLVFNLFNVFILCFLYSTRHIMSKISSQCHGWAFPPWKCSLRNTHSDVQRCLTFLTSPSTCREGLRWNKGYLRRSYSTHQYFVSQVSLFSKQWQRCVVFGCKSCKSRNCELSRITKGSENLSAELETTEAIALPSI